MLFAHILITVCEIYLRKLLSRGSGKLKLFMIFIFVCLKTSFRSVMVWSEAKDLLMLSAVAAEGVFNHKQVSRERGSAWQRAASTLCAQEGNFNVTARFVRDRFNVLAKKLRVKLSREEKESGGGDLDQSDVEKLLEALLELSDECDHRTDETEAKKECAESKKKRALEMRERVMERFGEIRKRKEEEKDEPRKVKQRQRSGGEAIDWLKEKAAAMKEVKEKEIQERKEE